VALFRKTKAREVAADERSPGSGVKYKDLVVMNRLEEHGADLGEPREVVFYSYAPTLDVAKAMAAEAADQGFDIEIREPLAEDPDLFAVICAVRAVLDPIFVRGAVEFFEGLASRHDAEYDGWEAEV
jgi:regulator of RNase E activity RraB